MIMEKQLIDYKVGNTDCKGVLFFKKSTEKKRPGLVVAHAWRGLEDYAIKKAEELAELGYVVLAADLYGNGKVGTTDEEAAALMFPLFVNRKLLRERILGALETLKQHPMVNPHKVGAVGFCFGGLTVLELFKSGALVNGVVIFHGIFSEKRNGHKAALEPTSDKIKGSILALQGNDDPFAPQEDLDKFKTELTKLNVDWQLHLFGNVVHAFTNPAANNKEKGMVSDSIATKRSWKLMTNFFEEVFNK